MEAPDTLQGRRWSLQAIALEGMQVDGAEDTGAYIVLGADGRAYGMGGCNRFSGSYSLEGSSITFGPMASTRMYCEDSMAVEDALFAALGMVTLMTVEKGKLVMSSWDGSTALTFSEEMPPVR